MGETLANAVQSWGVVGHGLDQGGKHVRCDVFDVCGWALLEELAITIEERVQHALLPLGAGIATIDLPKGFSDGPVNFEGMSLDDFFAILAFS